MNNNYENKILDAIQTLVDNAVTNAGYDKTIKCIISKCTNQSKGEYVVKYQDSSFYAYSNDLDSVYNAGTSVYVLVPGNDMAQTKTILGSVDKLGTEYINLSESSSAYQEIGTSIVTPNQNTPTFGVSSYAENGDSATIYNRETATTYVDVDTEGAEIYFQNAQYIEIGGTFITRLNEEQKRRGNYGLVFDISFKNGEEEVHKNYVIDINSMTGNPYSYNYGSTQTAIFEIDGANFYRLNSITLECKNFPHSVVSPVDDIFVEDIILKALTPLTRDEIANNSLTFITQQGIYFSDSDSADTTRLIETEVKINKKVVPNVGGLLRYYWFKQDSTVGLASPDYLPFGGPGWKCVNAYNVIDATNNIRDYITDEDTLTVAKDKTETAETGVHPEWHNLAKENEYKCVVIYNDEIQIERNIIIYNQASTYTITIESDQGNYFKYNEGNPTLTCIVSPAGTYTYTWSVTDNYNRTEVLAETSNIYSVELSSIANFSKFTCSVYNGQNFVGKSDIVITNSWDPEDNSYALVMENGDQIFKYNEKGIAPTNKSLEKPIVLKPLQFTLYDEMGHQVDDNKILSTDVFWYVPKDNTMISITDSGITPIEEDDYLIYNGLKTLNFTIANIYNIKKMNNTIKLVVRYNDRVLQTTSELEFIKEGEIGSNGTDFVCRIVPNVEANQDVPMYPMFTANMSTNPVTGDMNYHRPGGQSDKWFKIQLYKDGVNIFNGIASGTSDEGKAVTVEWSILKNKYSSTISDSSSFSVDSSTGAFAYIDLDDDLDRAANIVKVTVTYNNATYYATMPIILAQVINASGTTYSMNLEDNTGFRYVMYSTDGLNPIYDSSNPFTLKVYRTVSGTTTDITDDTNFDYTWSTLGQIYDGSTSTWPTVENFIERSKERNQASYRPIEKYDGLAVNNALKCIFKEGAVERARIYLPIHFYLNRFGNAALNGWDGNHIEINNNGGFILAPQVGAGKKESDNSFTGVFMGEVKEAGSLDSETGLFAYSHGERTVEIDSATGVAKFGKTGKGQVILNPTGTGHALIQSGDWSSSSHTGMEIDLTDPHILWGNGSFSVDKNGNTTAKSLYVGSSGDTNLNNYLTTNDENINELNEAVSVLQIYPATNSVYFNCAHDNKLLPGETNNYDIQMYPKFKNEDIVGTADNIVATFKQGSGWQSSPYTINNLTFTWNSLTQRLNIAVSNTTNAITKTSVDVKFIYTVSSDTYEEILTFTAVPNTKGEDGTSGTTYEVIPTVYSIIKGSEGTYTPTSVDFAAFSSSGDSHTAYAGVWITQYSADGSTWTTIATGSTDVSSVTINVSALSSSDPAFIRALICPAGTQNPSTSDALASQSVFIINDIEGIEVGGRNYIKYSDLEVSPIYNDEYSDTFTGDGETNRFVIKNYLINPNQDLAALSHLLMEEDIQDILINNTSIGNNEVDFTSTGATSYSFGSGLGKTYLGGYLPKKITGIIVDDIDSNYTLVGHSDQQVYQLGVSPTNIYSVAIYTEDGISQTVDSSNYSYSSGVLTFLGDFYPSENSQIIVTIYPYSYDANKYTLTFITEYQPEEDATITVKGAKYYYEPSIGVLTLWKTPATNDSIEVQYLYEYYSNIVPVKEGENWYLSYFVKAEQSYDDEICALELFDSLEASQPISTIYYSGQVSTEYQRLMNKYTVTNGIIGIRFRYLSLQSSANKQNTYKNIQLEKGSVTTDWVPNSEDMTIERFYYAPLIADVEARRVTKEDTNIDWITKEIDFDIYQTYMLEYLFDDIHYLWEKDKYIYKSDNVIESSIIDLKTRMEFHEEYYLSESSEIPPSKDDIKWQTETIKIDISNTDKSTYEKDYFIWTRTATLWSTGNITYSEAELDNTTNTLTKIAQQNGQAIINLSDKGYTRIFGDFIYLVDEAEMEHVQHGIVMGCGYDVGHSTAGGIAYFYYSPEEGQPQDPNNPMGWDENSHQYTKNVAFSSVWSVDGTMDLTHLNTVSIKASDIQDGTLTLGSDPNTPGHLEILSQDGFATISANAQGIRIRLNNGGEARITRTEGLIVTSKTERDPVTGAITGEDIKVFGSNSGGDGFESTKITVSQELDFKDYMKMIPIQQKDSNNNIIHKGIGFIKG